VDRKTEYHKRVTETFCSGNLPGGATGKLERTPDLDASDRVTPFSFKGYTR
jgi:hypothetical protein